MQTAVRPALSGFERVPLCANYTAVQLEVTFAHVAQLGARTDCALRWGLGIVNDGETEVLGVWPETGPNGWSSKLVAEDLLARGVQRIGLLIGRAYARLDDALLRAFPGASEASSFHRLAELGQSVASLGDREAIWAGMARVRSAESKHQAHAVLDALAVSSWQGSPAAVQACREAIESWQSLYALPKRARGQVCRGDHMTRLLQLGASRAVARQGPFNSADAAAAFVERWLGDAERRQRGRRSAQRSAYPASDLAAAMG